jgi:hypothetical protein
MAAPWACIGGYSNSRGALVVEGIVMPRTEASAI